MALTFDDGPRNLTTGPLLEGLALREVPATFFLVGYRIEGSEDLIREMAAAGHQIGVHTFDHTAVAGLSRRDFDLQVGKTRAVLTQLLGAGITGCAPPTALWMIQPGGGRTARWFCGRWTRRTGRTAMPTVLWPPCWSMWRTATSF